MIWIEKVWKNGLFLDYFFAVIENLGIGKKVEIVVE